jgi:hypothetical protein
MKPSVFKPVFSSPQEARRALASDKRGTVYVQVKKVFVITAYGSGTFTYREWKESANTPPMGGGA